MIFGRWVEAGAVKLDGSAASAATFNSDWYPFIGDMLTLAVRTTSLTGTLAVKLQISPDGGTTAWDTYPTTDDTETQAVLGNITTNKETSKMFPVPLPPVADPQGVVDSIEPRWRIVFTITTGPITIAAWISQRDYGVGQ